MTSLERKVCSEILNELSKAKTQIASMLNRATNADTSSALEIVNDRLETVVEWLNAMVGD